MGGAILIYTKICTTCKKEKNLDSFYNSRAYKDGKSYRCKSCDAEARKAYHKKHKDRHLKLQRIRNRKHKYGISEEEYRKMINDQNNKCAICGVELEINDTNIHTSTTLCIDHCHSTGIVRGLLCTRCNKALGLFDDNVYNLKSAIKYLMQYNE